MGAEDFLQDPQIRGWLDGVEPAGTLLTFESLRALRREPSAAPLLSPLSASLASLPRAAINVVEHRMGVLDFDSGFERHTNTGTIPQKKADRFNVLYLER